MNPTDTMGFLSELDKTQDVYRNNVGGLEKQLKKRKGVPEPTVKAIAAQRLRKELEDKERKVNAELQQDPNSIVAQNEAFLGEATQRDIAKGVSDVMDMRNMRRQKGAQKAAQRFAKVNSGTGIMSALTGSPQKKKEAPRDPRQPQVDPRQLQRQQGTMVGAAGGLAKFSKGDLAEKTYSKEEIERRIRLLKRLDKYKDKYVGEEEAIASLKQDARAAQAVKEAPGKVADFAESSAKTAAKGTGTGLDFLGSGMQDLGQYLKSIGGSEEPEAPTAVDKITTDKPQQDPNFRFFDPANLPKDEQQADTKDDIVEQFLDKKEEPKKEDPKPADAGLGLMTPDQEQAYIDQNIGPDKGRLEKQRTEQIGTAREVDPATGKTIKEGTGLKALQDKILDSQTNLETGQKGRRTKFDEQTKEREGRLDELYGEDARKKAVSAGFSKGLSPFGSLSQTKVGEYQAGRRFDIAEEAGRRGQESREIKSEDMNVDRLTQNVTNAKENLTTEKGFADTLATAKKEDIQIVQNVLNNMATNARTKAIVKQADATIEIAKQQAGVDLAKAKALVAEKIADVEQSGKTLLETNSTYADLQEAATKLLKKGSGNENNLDAEQKAKYDAIVKNIALMERGYTSDLTESLVAVQQELNAMKRGGLAALM